MDSSEAAAGFVWDAAPTAVTRQQPTQTDHQEVKDRTRRVRAGHSADTSDSDTSMSIARDPQDNVLSSISSRRGSGPEAEAKVTESNKRKLEAFARSVDVGGETAKRAKRDEVAPSVLVSLHACKGDLSLLPAEVWHRIFTLVHPTTLGKLLRVNTVFNSYLNPLSTPKGVSRRLAGCTSSLPPESIWQASRRRFCPRMPAPMRDRTELDMWKLAYPGSCQFCGKPNQELSVPGVQDKTHVRTVWPFALRSCGPCLLDHSTKEIDLLLSSSIPSLLIPALPFVFTSQGLDIYTPRMLQMRQIPGDVTKLFLTKSVHELMDEFQSVKSMGSATVEEWLKGLEARGKELRTSWEKWELAGAHAAAKNARREDLVSGVHNGGPDFTRSSSATPSAVPSRAASVSQACSESTLRSQTRIPRARTLEEVGIMKAARRTEIERRAMLLKPPLLPPVLERIPSFQAAIQITMPFNDHSWNLLKPRLLAQCGEAEYIEKRKYETAEDRKDGLGHASLYQKLGGTTREAKEVSDRTWDDAQEPLRAQISAYADEYVKDCWDDGGKVNRENGPSFATDTLLQVRKRFYAEVAQDIASARAAGREPVHDQPEGPYTQKLTLENMKWLYETKIKPHAASRELFLCNGCEGSSKLFGFEGVIQHYAAKHANGKLSRGSVVVYWRSEWPAVPLFRSDPQSKGPKPTAQLKGSKTTAQLKGSKPTASNTHTRQKNPVSQPSSTGPSSYGAAYSHDQGPSMMLGIQGQVPQPLSGYVPSYPLQPPAYNHPYSQGSWPHSGGANTMIQYYEHSGGLVPDDHGSLPPSAPYHQHVAMHQGDNPGICAERMRLQLEDLAQNSRDIWMAISGLKNIPGNIRIHVVIHHAVRLYRLRFYESPPLAMFMDGLSNKKGMRPVRNVNNLVCKSCYLHPDPGNAVGEVKTFSLPRLVSHFQQHHIEFHQAMSAPLPDWTVEMVCVSNFTSLTRLRGIDAHQRSLIMEAFPGISMPDFQFHHSTSTSDVQSGVYTHGEMPSKGRVVQTYSRDRLEKRLPDAKQELMKTARGELAGLKDKRTVSGQRRLQWKDGAKAGGTVFPSRRPNIDSKEDDEGEIEEQRQEQAIRAMWAAERRDTARVDIQGPASPRNLPPQDPRDPSKAIRGTGSVEKHPVSALVLGSRVASRDVVSNISRTQVAQAEDDLFAGLESHLDQHQMLSPCGPGAIPCERVAAMAPSEYEAPLYDGCPVFIERPRAQSIRPLSLSRAAVSIQQPARSQSVHYRQQNPSFPEEGARYPETARMSNPMYHGSLTPMEPEGYAPVGWDGNTRFKAGQGWPHTPVLVHGADTHVDNSRNRMTRANTRPVETYELLHMRDAEGECYIRRRVDPLYASVYEDEAPVPGGRRSPLGVYPPEPLRRDSGEHADRYAARGPSPSIMAMRGQWPLRGHEYTVYDEYDPRSPASLGGDEPHSVR